MRLPNLGLAEDKRPRRIRRLIGCILFSFLAAVALPVARNYPAISNYLRRRLSSEVQVVKTWRELSTTRPRLLAEGVTVKLGIESKECPEDGGVLLYCETEGFAPPTRFGCIGDWLGPLRVSCNGEGCPAPQEAPVTLNKGRLVFVRDVQPDFDVHGDALLRFAKPNGDVLAECHLRKTVEPDHGFLSLARNVNEDVLSPSFRSALPTFDGTAFYGAEDMIAQGALPLSEDGPLPVFPTRGAVESLSLSLRDGVASVGFPSGTASCPLNPAYFLIRMWVNGVPFNPIPKGFDNWPFDDRWTLEGSVQFGLRIEPESVGARRGDRIGVQMLYCPHGFGVANQGRVGSRNKRNLYPMLTNRAEYAVP